MSDTFCIKYTNLIDFNVKFFILTQLFQARDSGPTKGVQNETERGCGMTDKIEQHWLVYV